MGKTRLALQAGRPTALGGAYPDGVWLVGAGGAGRPGAGARRRWPAPSACARSRAGPLLATLTDALRPKRLLLVLDNCEHLLDACARLADALLRACPT